MAIVPALQLSARALFWSTLVSPLLRSRLSLVMIDTLLYDFATRLPTFFFGKG